MSRWGRRWASGGWQRLVQSRHQRRRGRGWGQQQPPLGGGQQWPWSKILATSTLACAPSWQVCIACAGRGVCARVQGSGWRGENGPRERKEKRSVSRRGEGERVRGEGGGGKREGEGEGGGVREGWQAGGMRKGQQSCSQTGRPHLLCPLPSCCIGSHAPAATEH